MSTSTLMPSKDATMTIGDSIEVMIDYCIRHGIALPPNLELGDQLNKEQKVSNFNLLSKAITPATVASILYIDQEILADSEHRKWYKIPVFSKCLYIALLALVLLVGMSLLPNVNEANQSRSLLSSSGLVLLANIIFICSASLLGVMFFLLKTISEKIKTYTLSEIDVIEINSSIIIGLISGFIISELFQLSQSTIGDFVEIQKMTLALLGGFASDTIFTTLKGLITRLKSVLIPG